jgi:polysaccharide chain length determinant protein (PEP-CTERM system associated)
VNRSPSIAEKAAWVVRCVSTRRWTALGVVAAAGVAAAIAVVVMPQRYEATAKVYVDTQTVLKPMMVGLTFQPDVDQQVRMLARTLISRPNVEKLVDSPDLKLDVALQRERDKTVSRLMEQIHIVAAERGGLYTISYRDVDPARALKIVESTLALFVDTGSSGKRKDSIDARNFVDTQIHGNEAKLVEAENRLKDFKLRNFGVTGVSNQDYFAHISTLSDEVSKLRADLGAAEHARDSYRRELAGEDPQLPAGSFPLAAPPEALEIDARIESQQKQLDDLLRRFTDSHPDVIASRRTIAALQEQRRAEMKARAAAADGRTHGNAATSPVYQRIRIALAESEAQVASLSAQLASQNDRLQQTRALAGRLPQVEAEFAQLNRDYDVMRKNYDQLVERRESASLAVKLDESSQLADFRSVEPPRVSPKPVFPGKLHVALIGLMLAIASGIGVAVLLDVVRPTLHDDTSLELLAGRPCLGMISLSKTATWQGDRRRERLRFLSATGLLVALELGWLIWTISRPALV